MISKGCLAGLRNAMLFAAGLMMACSEQGGGESPASEAVDLAGQDAPEAAIAERRVAAGAAGTEFLAQNAGRPEVAVLPSGLQYEVLVAAEGPTPGPDSRVTTHYEGRLIDDTVFDSSIARGAPASFRLNQVIAGWTEALQLMSPGAKWRLFIPSELAYGERGAGQLIGPHATLVFDVELISIDD